MKMPEEKRQTDSAIDQPERFLLSWFARIYDHKAA